MDSFGLGKTISTRTKLAHTNPVKNAFTKQLIQHVIAKKNIVPIHKFRKANYNMRFAPRSFPTIKSHAHSKSKTYPDINNDLKRELPSYLQDIKNVTGLSVSPKQTTLIENYIDTTPIHKLSFQDMNQHRQDFSMNKAQIRKDWELNNNVTWPRYTENVVVNGKIMRQFGYAYDAHHIIENSYGGPNVWWNMHPARFPEQHQDGIHRDDGIAAKLFGKIGSKHHVAV